MMGAERKRAREKADHMDRKMQQTKESKEGHARERRREKAKLATDAVQLVRRQSRVRGRVKRGRMTVCVVEKEKELEECE